MVSGTAVYRNWVPISSMKPVMEGRNKIDKVLSQSSAAPEGHLDADPYLMQVRTL